MGLEATRQPREEPHTTSKENTCHNGQSSLVGCYVMERAYVHPYVCTDSGGGDGRPRKGREGSLASAALMCG